MWKKSTGLEVETPFRENGIRVVEGGVGTYPSLLVLVLGPTGPVL